MPANIYVAADFSQMESFLTAYFAQDDVMWTELQDSLKPGGIKVHALNAALLYDIDPADAKTHEVEIQGQITTAYKGGKKVSHLINYGGQPKLLHKQLWLPLEFCYEAHRKITGKYVPTTRWRERLVEKVYGVIQYLCNSCGHESNIGGVCPHCTRSNKPVPMVYQGWLEPPTRELFTPFLRRRRYLGRRNDGANALASQLPQSCGASIWYRTLQRLNGFTATSEGFEPWPIPTGYRMLTQPYQAFEYQNPIATGTYDSFVVECAPADRDTIAAWLAWTMEQAWPQLGGIRIPAEVEWGENWYDLREMEYQAFSATNPFEEAA